MKFIFGATGFFFFVLFFVLFTLWLATADQCSFAMISNICGHKAEIFAAEVLNRETAVGVFVSALGTAALILTVYYSRQATVAAMEASHAANLAIVHARETSARDLRPYMVEDEQRSLRIFAKEDPNVVGSWNFQIWWKNVGKTPALNVFAGANCCVVKDGLPENFQFPDRDGDKTAGTLGPGGRVGPETRPIPVKDLQAAARGECVLHVWSWIEYEDAPGYQRYRDEYHGTLTIWGDDPSTPNPNIDWYMARRFNGSDGTCFRLPVTPLAKRLYDN